MLGIHSSSGLLSWANNHTNAYRFIDNAASLIAYYDPLTTGIRVGQFSEDNHFLGSRADGGYILKKPSQSNYIHASITSRHANWTAAASATVLRTRTYFNYSHFVDDMTLKSNSYHFQSIPRRCHAGRRQTLCFLPDAACGNQRPDDPAFRQTLYLIR